MKRAKPRTWKAWMVACADGAIRHWGFGITPERPEKYLHPEDADGGPWDCGPHRVVRVRVIEERAKRNGGKHGR